jgi:hypothetical protein
MGPDLTEDASEASAPPLDGDAIATELALVESFVARAPSLPNDAKARSFLPPGVRHTGTFSDPKILFFPMVFGVFPDLPK